MIEVGGIYNMELLKKNNYIELVDKNKKLEINFLHNGELYWVIRDRSNSNIKIFEITKEDYQIYELFDLLYNDIKSKNIYNVYEEIKKCTSKKQLLKVYRKYEEHNKYIKEYDDLNSNDSITWVSDNNHYEIANIVTILKEEDKYVLIFNVRDYCGHNSIRFSNSGSRYNPYNRCFMKHFKNLCNLEIDKNQINIEEYIYLKKVKKK